MSRKATGRTPRTKRPTFPTVAHWREAHDLNQREAAQVLGVNQTKYSRIERGLQVPMRDDLKRIHFVTGVPVEVLVGVA